MQQKKLYCKQTGLVQQTQNGITYVTELESCVLTVHYRFINAEHKRRWVNFFNQEITLSIFLFF